MMLPFPFFPELLIGQFKKINTTDSFWHHNSFLINCILCFGWILAGSITSASQSLFFINASLLLSSERYTHKTSQSTQTAEGRPTHSLLKPTSQPTPMSARVFFSLLIIPLPSHPDPLRWPAHATSCMLDCVCGGWPEMHFKCMNQRHVGWGRGGGGGRGSSQGLTSPLPVGACVQRLLRCGDCLSPL